jgi:hypothetical protein
MYYRVEYLLMQEGTRPLAAVKKPRFPGSSGVGPSRLRKLSQIHLPCLLLLVFF